jgi:hypothetical protein
MRSRCCIPSSSAVPSTASTRCWGRPDVRNRVLGNRAQRLEQSFRTGIKDKGQLQLGRESAERGKSAGRKD